MSISLLFTTKLLLYCTSTINVDLIRAIHKKKKIDSLAVKEFEEIIEK